MHLTTSCSNSHTKIREKRLPLSRIINALFTEKITVNQIWAKATEGKTLLIPKHSFNTFSKPCQRQDVGTGGSQQKLTTNFTCSSTHKLQLDVYH